MPLLTVHLTTAPDAERDRAVAATLTELTGTHLEKAPALTAVTIGHVDPARWFIGAAPLPADGTQSFSLDIKVTQGTNTKRQMAAYIDAVFAAMRQLLGGVDDVSYVVVHEVPAAAWGYGGVTQEVRAVAPPARAA